MSLVKVNKFRKQKYLFSIFSKHERNIWQILTYLLGQNIFIHFLGELRKNIFAFEIYWPLGHRFVRVEFRIFAVVFLFFSDRCTWKNENKYIFEILQVQINELPRTWIAHLIMTFFPFFPERDDQNRTIALPQDQLFWDDLFANATKWGLEMYEQDWLDVQYLMMKYLTCCFSASQEFTSEFFKDFEPVCFSDRNSLKNDKLQLLWLEFQSGIQGMR